MSSLIKKLTATDQTVFSIKEIAALCQETDIKKINNRVNHYLQTGELISLRRGIYALSSKYDSLELATRIYTPCYISMQTVLTRASVIFQFYPQIFLISYLSREITVDNQTMVFKKMKDSVLYDVSGIEFKNNISISTVERAFLDMIYLYPSYYFDNLNPLNWDKCFELKGIYSNKSLNSRLEQYYKDYKNA